MKLKDLIEKLGKYNQDMDVVLACGRGWVGEKHSTGVIFQPKTFEEVEFCFCTSDEFSMNCERIFELPIEKTWIEQRVLRKLPKKLIIS